MPIVPNSEQQPSTVPTTPMPPWWVKHTETLRIILVALVIAFLLRAYVVEPRFIPSGSMEPTLLVSDRILVDKISYLFHPPQRGDILVFYPPASPVIEDNSKAYIKRLIGLPGDRISIRGGKVLLNGEPLPEPYIAAPPKYSMRMVTVPAGSYWVMGDNRNNSNDSHVWGFLPAGNVVGRAALRFYPLDERLGLIATPKY
jgi:signal peptidase I